MTDYAAVLRALAARRRFGVRPGLGAMQEALDRCGNPERAAPAIHIAGTNGKGSTAAMAAALLRQAGRRVALYTSPHLCRLVERIGIDGAAIDDGELAPRLEAAMEREPDLTFFEIVTLVAFELFAAAGCDGWVVEVGLGGRLDATNTLALVRASVIVSIGLDHQSLLGDDLASIAVEKAGIARRGVPLFTGPMPAPAHAAIAAHAATIGAPLHSIDPAVRLPPEMAIPALQGAHQRTNAALAIAASEAWLGHALPAATIATALQTVSWPGRAEWLRDDLLIDGAHNPDGARVLAALLDALPTRPRVLVFGASVDKPIAEMLAILAPRFAHVVMTRAASDRAAAPEALAALWPGAHARPDVAAALALAAALGGSTVVAGSLFLVGEVRATVLGLALDPPWVSDPPWAKS